MNLFDTKQWKKVVLLSLLISLFGLYSCDDSSTSSDEEVDAISDLLYVSGNQITKKYSDWPIPENDVPSVDTTRIGFLMKIHSLQGEGNSIRIYGLEGADVGKREDYLYPGCNHPDDCEIIGTLADEVLEINIENNGRSYEAEGNIYQTYDPYVEMNATYNYQNTTIEYELEGGVFEE